MDCCDITSHIDIPAGTKKIVLAGNPNVGKSIFFNSFTGIYVAVSNYPGTTLDISSGFYNPYATEKKTRHRIGSQRSIKHAEKKNQHSQGYAVIDTPGVYGVSSFNDEEIVARDVILAADIVVNVVDAVHLERDLFLTQQIIDMGIPVVMALNMMDEAEKNGLEIDIDKLSSELEIPVIPTIASKGKGLDEIKEALKLAVVGNSILEKNEFIKRKLIELTDTINKPEAVSILEGDPHIAKRHNREPLQFQEEIYRMRRERVNEVIDRTVAIKTQGTNFKTLLGNLMLKPITGIPMLLMVLYLLYQFIGVFIAQTVVGWTEEAFFIERYEPFISSIIGRLIDPVSFIGKLLIGEYGIFTMAVTYTLGLLLPLVIGFYFSLALMEDSGYLPRIAALVDRMLISLGLNGRAIIPMILGFGCVTMATITTRLLGSNRERIIAIFLLGLAVPCSAQLGVIAGLIAPLGLKYFIIYVVTLVLVYVVTGTILNKILPGKSTDLLIDLPPLRLPNVGNVFKKTYIKSISFIKEAGPIFVLGAVLITIMQESGFLTSVQNLVAPITVGWLKLPKETATAFIMGIVRRDFGAAGLNSLPLTPEQTTIALITITLFVPCIAAMMIMVKERNWKEALAIWAGSWITAFAVGGIVAYLI